MFCMKFDIFLSEILIVSKKLQCCYDLCYFLLSKYYILQTILVNNNTFMSLFIFIVIKL